MQCVLCLLLAVVVVVRAGHPVSDPFGKWDWSQKRAIQKCFDDWNDHSRYPAPKLSVKQKAWFYSLGCASVTDSHYQPSDPKYNPFEKRIRKEYRMLTKPELFKLNDAILAMKNSYPDPADKSVSEYDIFVEQHVPTLSPAAHEGPAFLPWHREYLWRFEQALRLHDPDVTLPYWDSSLDQDLPEPNEAIIWVKELLGNNDGVVDIGPFANWRTTETCAKQVGPKLMRNAAFNPNASALLYSVRDVNYVLNKKKFRDIVAPFDSKFEDDHAAVHVYLGGHMSEVACAPNDPVFWMHHAYIDCIWEEFREQQVTWPEKEYPFDSIIPREHRAFSWMEPFRPQYNIHGLSNHYTNYYYKCADRFTKCSTNDDCGGMPLIWCDRKAGKCRSKIHLGGNCGDYADDACWEHYRCIKSKCTAPPFPADEPERPNLPKAPVKTHNNAYSSFYQRWWKH